jgi:hypothetical protein
MRIETIEQYNNGWTSEDREDTIMKKFSTSKEVIEESCRFCNHRVFKGCEKWCCDTDLNEYCFMFENNGQYQD